MMTCASGVLCPTLANPHILSLGSACIWRKTDAKTRLTSAAWNVDPAPSAVITFSTLSPIQRENKAAAAAVIARPNGSPRAAVPDTS